MEAKTLLRLIKDDIAHLEGITGDFLFESLPLSDEVELALVRSNTLLKELELLHKIAVQHEKKSIALNDQLKKEEITEPGSDNEITSEEHFSALVEPSESIDETPEVPSSTEEEVNPPFTILTEPAESVDVAPASPIVVDEEITEKLTADAEPIESVDVVPFSPVADEEDIIGHHSDENELVEAVSEIQDESAEKEEKEIVDQLKTEEEATAIIDTVTVSDIGDHKDEILADEFGEVKKTLNESLGESHQMVNDILSAEKDETGFRVIPINSIWDGIGINDRFLFIRELFANSSAKFENTVAALDKLVTIQEAVTYLKMNFKWNKTEASQKFLVLVKRRFTK